MELLERQRDQQRPDQHREQHDRPGPRTHDTLWIHFRTDSKTSISGWKMLAARSMVRRLLPVLSLEQALVLDGIEASVAPRIASKQPPAGQDQPAEYAESSIACAAYSEHDG